MSPNGLKPHTHAERAAVIAQLIPLWQAKFGDKLLGIAACASYARGEDAAYSDLELDLFLDELPEDEDPYYQRVVDGLLIEVVYHTPAQFLHERSGVLPHWHLSASDRLEPVYNTAFIEKLLRQIQAYLPADRPSEVDFWHAAARKRYELQEAFAKVLNAIEQDNLEGISLLLMDAVLQLLHILALINQQPFVTFARYIPQARRFAIKPEGLDALLDILVQATYRDLPHLKEVVLRVFTGVEELFVEHGWRLYDDPSDPNTPNLVLPLSSGTVIQTGEDVGARAGIHLVPVDRNNWRRCAKLPTGPDHRHVAPNAYSIAEAHYSLEVRSCCIYDGDEMVGYVMYGPDYDDKLECFLMWVGRLMIAEPQRDKGYGRAVLQQIIAETRRLGYTVVGLSTHPDNAKAIGLYESLGFRATEIEDGEMIYILSLG